ncbi:hypothetical protein QUA74_28940, partial [Microcoleus sp. LAD1_D3]|uniref:hypothetical protein n=1 Tax=unclassified Microcoleus TaxID=2642155 RepID=UPI002FD056F8
AYIIKGFASSFIFLNAVFLLFQQALGTVFLLGRRRGKRGGLQNLTCFLLLPIAASNSCRAGNAQTSTSESGWDF